MKQLLILLTATVLCSCNWAKQKAKSTVNKTGEVVAKAGAEFADGVAKGVEKTFRNEVVFSGGLKEAGLSAGKMTITSADSATDNVLTAYLIFDKDIDRQITVKVFNEEGKEYGRVRQTVQAQKGDAKYIDFVFDKRTNIDGKGKVVFE
ncbi:MAG TPA: hypothetical protein VFS25_18555 [Chitinophaga sp.]|uniref:hypothetical protein n=1 Tax=Chitinophaga sp. TaxID=1869181 RepID=UPI002DB6F01B|nr:hypothetical protein [Chitinophaga sp.]HEU4554857.1 hypothetical protein [Chitinophaga sp.]